MLERSNSGLIELILSRGSRALMHSRTMPREEYPSRSRCHCTASELEQKKARGGREEGEAKINKYRFGQPPPNCVKDHRYDFSPNKYSARRIEIHRQQKIEALCPSVRPRPCGRLVCPLGFQGYLITAERNPKM